jgi:hypothetical protein
MVEGTIHNDLRQQQAAVRFDRGPVMSGGMLVAL